MFNTKNVQDNAPKSRFLTFGINEGVHIHGVEGFTPDGKAPYLEFTLSLGDINSATKLKMYASTGAIPTTIKRLIHLAGVLDVRAELDNAYSETDSIQVYATKLNKIFSDRVVRMKLSGEEYVNQNGETKVRLGIPVFNFAERMDVSPSKLTFDVKNQYDYKALPLPDSTGAPANDEPSDLPF